MTSTATIGKKKLSGGARTAADGQSDLVSHLIGGKICQEMRRKHVAQMSFEIEHVVTTSVLVLKVPQCLVFIEMTLVNTLEHGSNSYFDLLTISIIS